MRKMWILVADKAKARIFLAEKPLGPITELEALVHPESRLHARDLVSDAPGRTFDRSGEGRHAKEPNVDPKETEAIKFAIEIADRLEAARVRGEFDRLGLVAAPEFLGLLRERLGPETRALVEFEIDKDLMHLRPQEIRARLPERLFSAV